MSLSIHLIGNNFVLKKAVVRKTLQDDCKNIDGGYSCDTTDRAPLATFQSPSFYLHYNSRSDKTKLHVSNREHFDNLALKFGQNMGFLLDVRYIPILIFRRICV